MLETIDAWFIRDTIRLPPGRIVFSATAIERLLVRDEVRLVGPALADAIKAGRQAVLLESRRTKSSATYGEGAREADEAVDDVLNAVSSLLESFARVHGPSTRIGAAARHLADVFFPFGLRPVSNASYPEELAHLERIVSQSTDRNHLADVEAVPGLAPLLVTLAERTAAFDAALHRDAKGVTYREARAAADAADRRITEAVMTILALYRGDHPTAAARRTELVAPYATQLAEMRERYRRRLPPIDVDPETGAPVEGSAEAASSSEPAPTEGSPAA